MKQIISLVLSELTVSLTLQAQTFRQEFGAPRKAFVETIAKN